MLWYSQACRSSLAKNSLLILRFFYENVNMCEHWTAIQCFDALNAVSFHKSSFVRNHVTSVKQDKTSHKYPYANVELGLDTNLQLNSRPSDKDLPPTAVNTSHLHNHSVAQQFERMVKCLVTVRCIYI